jgi:hypothetical protein
MPYLDEHGTKGERALVSKLRGQLEGKKKP